MLTKDVWARNVRKNSNMVKNPGFEETFGKKTLPKYWYLTCAGVNDNPDSVYCGTSHKGLHSAHLWSDADTGEVHLHYSLAIPVKTGNCYSLMGFVKTDSIKGFAQVTAVFLDSAKTVRSKILPQTFTATNSWQEFYMDARAPEKAAFAAITCELHGIGHVYFDDIYFSAFKNIAHPKADKNILPGMRPDIFVLTGIIILIAGGLFVFKIKRK
ncbi:MAG: hypothetical protein ABIA63_04105 [bacterium]